MHLAIRCLHTICCKRSAGIRSKKLNSNKSVFSLLRRLLTRRCPHLLLSAGTYSRAPERACSYRSISFALGALNSKPADAAVDRWDRRTDARPLHYTEPAPHSTPTASIMWLRLLGCSSIVGLSVICTLHAHAVCLWRNQPVIIAYLPYQPISHGTSSVLLLGFYSYRLAIYDAFNYFVIFQNTSQPATVYSQVLFDLQAWIVGKLLHVFSLTSVNVLTLLLLFLF